MDQVNNGGTAIQEGVPHCSECDSIVEQGDSFCTGCGAQFAFESANDQPVEAHCFTCGLDVPVEESVCPRCESPVFVEASKDDDDEEDEDDDEAEDDDEDEEDGKKKLLLDKGRKKKDEEFARRTLTPQEEARTMVDLAMQLSEQGRADLAAQIVFGEANDREIDPEVEANRPPRWLPETHHDAWREANTAGRPKTLMGAVHATLGLVANR